MIDETIDLSILSISYYYMSISQYIFINQMLHFLFLAEPTSVTDVPQDIKDVLRKYLSWPSNPRK